MIAQAPATCGEAMEVPLNKENDEVGTEEFIDSPGANKSSKLELLEKLETVSDLVVDPTLTTLEIQAGEDNEVDEPEFPELDMVTISTERNRSIGTFNNSESQGKENEPLPTLMLTEAMAKVRVVSCTVMRDCVMGLPWKFPAMIWPGMVISKWGPSSSTSSIRNVVIPSDTTRVS